MQKFNIPAYLFSHDKGSIEKKKKNKTENFGKDKLEKMSMIRKYRGGKKELCNFWQCKYNCFNKS